MTAHTRALVLFSAVLHLWIGLGELWMEGNPIPPSWQVMYRHVPEWPWAWSFVLVGYLAMIGTVSAQVARIAFFFSAFLFAAWGAFSFWAWAEGRGSTVPGTLQLLYVAALQLGIAEYVFRVERVTAQVEALGEKVDEVRGRVDAG